MLSVASPPDRATPTAAGPLAVELGLIDDDGLVDMAVLGSDGSLTVALNQGNGTWRSVATTNLGVGTSNGLELARLDFDPVNDLIVQGPNTITVARGDGAGGFATTQTITPGAPGTLVPADGGRVGLATTLVDGDFHSDLVAVAPGTDEVLVFLGSGAGTFGTPARYASGADQPVDVAVGNFIGGVLPDLAVGHRDGNVTFLEGRPGGTFLLRPELTAAGLGSVAGLAAADFNGDGELDLAVSGTDRVVVLSNIDDVLTIAPLSNGDFTTGMTGWTPGDELGLSTLSSQPSTASVSTLGGFVQLRESTDSLLTTLSQTFVVPPTPQTVTFDIVAMGLEAAPDGSIPDVFEASLLDPSGNSLVLTFRPEATSFFNASVVGQASSLPTFSLASGVTFDGTRVTLDISSLLPGTSATLVFDLVGNPPGSTSVVSIDNVTVAPEAIYAETFGPTSLAGPFGQTAGIAAGDVDGDGKLDIIVADAGLGRLLVYNADGSGGFSRMEVFLSGFGTGAEAVATGPLTPGDTIDDIAVTMFGSNVTVTPIRFVPPNNDTTPPTVTLVDPAPNLFVSAAVTQLRVRFSELVMDNGPAGMHSVTNPASYRLFTNGANNLFEDGGGDDRLIAISSISFNSTTLEAVLAIAAGDAPLADEKYQLVVEGDDARDSIQDLAGNSLGGGTGSDAPAGTDASFLFVVDTVAPTASVTLSPNILWPPNHKMVTINATVTSSDANAPTPSVVLLSVTSNEPDNGQGDGDTANDIQGVSAGTDDRVFQVRRERSGGGNGRVYTANYYVFDDACNGRVVSQVVVVPHDRGSGQQMIDQIGDPTPPGLGNLLTCMPGAINDPPFNIGDTVNDGVVAGEVDVWTFTATAGQRLYFDAQAGASGLLRWVLTPPGGGAPLINNFFFDVGVLTMPTTGTYAMTIDTPFGIASGYQFKVWDVPAPTTTPITIGQTVNGDIQAPGELDFFGYSATAGQHLYFDAQSSFPGNVRWIGTDPNGVELFNNFYFDSGVLVAPVTGDYLIRVDAPFGTTGFGYQFKVWDVPNLPPQAIATNQAVHGDIVGPGEHLRYTLAATAGQRLFFDAVDVSGLNLRWIATDPNGAIFFNQFFSDVDTRVISVPGTYTIDFDAPFGDLRSFVFEVWDVPVPVPQPIAFRQVVRGDIVIPGEQDHFTFAGAAGQLAYFDAQETGTFFSRVGFAIRRPDGSELFPLSTDDRGTFVLPVTGTYTVVADGASALDSTGGYRFQVWDVPPDVAQPIVLGDAVPNAIDVPGQTRSFTFAAAAGESLTFDLIWNQSAATTYTLRGPTGSVVFSTPSGSPGDVTVPSLPSTGTYTLTADPGAPGDNIGTFSFRVYIGAAPPVPAAAELTVSGVTVPQRTIGDPAEITVTWTVTNSGPAAATDWTDRVRISTDAILGGFEDWRVADVPFVGTLLPGQSITRTHTFNLPARLDGDLQAFVQVDVTNRVFEGTAETNNHGAASNRTAVYRFALPATGEPNISLDLADGSRFPAGETVALSGRAQALPGSVNVVYVVDVSSSTLDVTGLDANFDGQVNAADDLNGNGFVGDILDTEIGAMLLMNDRLAPNPARVAVVAFSSGGEVMDLGADFFSQSFADADADANTNGRPDFEEAVRSLFTGVLTGANLFRSFSMLSATNFQAAINATTTLLDRRLDADSTKVFFLTDGTATAEPSDVELQQIAARGIEFHGFQITGSSVTSSMTRMAALIDAEPLSTGTTTLVSDPNDLAAALMGTLEIESVTVNGSPADLLDDAGNFIEPIAIAAGNNLFTITAVDSNGQTSARTLTLVGTTTTGCAADLQPDCFAELRDVTGVGVVSFSGTTYNRHTGRLLAEARLTNTGTDPLDGPVLAAFDQITPTAVSLATADGTHPDGRPYVCFVAVGVPASACPNLPHGELAPTGLDAGATSRPLLVAFINPPSPLGGEGRGEGLRFSFDLSLLALGNDAPFFSSVPVVSGSVDVAYGYSAIATDPNDNSLEYRLQSAPAGMTVHPVSGVVSWTPTAAQLGTHSVELVADDNRGGTTTQFFNVTVSAPVTNRPPVILSRPPLVATQGELYTYDMAAFDPDSDPITFTIDPATLRTGMSIDPSSGVFTWTPSAADLGSHTITILALDPCAAGTLPDCSAGPGTQTFTLEVRGPNSPPEFASDPVLAVIAGELYRYNANATDADSCGAGGPPAGSGPLACDTVTFSLVPGPDSPPVGMTIHPRSGQVLWLTTASDLGPHPVTVRATDDQGAFTDQPYTLTVLPDTVAPTVSVLLSATVIQPGDSVTIQVVANDNVTVSTRTLEIDGLEFPLDLNHSAVFPANAPGRPTIVATATDPSGNVGLSCDLSGSQPSTLNPQPFCSPLRVTDPADTTAPLVTITDPASGTVVTYLTDILGTITDPNLEFYRLERARVGTDEFVPFFERVCLNLTPEPCPLTPVSGLLGTFDPTMLPNDDYVVRAVAGDFSGNIATSGEITLGITANAKLGNFRLEFTDLQVPVVGVPITIGRIYDTLEASEAGDFGFGWRLDIRQARIRETVRISPLEAAGVPDIFGAFPFRTGTRVYLNNPEGRRVGFTFDPIPEPGFTGTIWHPRFTADPGVFDRLEVEDIVLQQRPDGTFQLFSFFGAQSFPYNPREYTLVTKDGISYRHDQFSGLLDITDRNSNVLTYTPGGIFASSGQSIQFIRDPLGRISEIVDPAGNSIQYDYDAHGDLVSVIDQTDNETSFTYLTPDDPFFRPHYLAQITDPLGHAAVRADYDDAGRIVSSSDALGNTAAQSYDPANNTELISDRLGNESTLVYDDRGNVVSMTDPLGHTTSFTYDANDKETSTTDPRGFTTSRTFDERGNLTSITDPLAQLWTLTYNTVDKIATASDPLGRTVSYRYDVRGNLVELVDAAGSSSFISYDGAGRATSSTDSNGNTTSYLYGSGPLPAEVINPDGTRSHFEYSPLGDPTRLTDENGNETVFAYDAVGRLDSVRDAQGELTLFGYDAHRLISVNDPLGHTTRYEYDDADRQIREVDPMGGTSEFAYDANGRLLTLTDPRGHDTIYSYRPDGRVASVTVNPTTFYFYDEAGNLIEVTDANGDTMSYEYDPLNRRTREINALAGTRSFAYDAVSNLTQLTDENGHTTLYAYDELDRLVRITDPLGGTELRSYDDAGNLTSVTDELGRSTLYAYDSMHRLTRTIDAAGGITEFDYDGVGNLVSTIDPLGHPTTHVFDTLNRRVQTVDALGGITGYTYDEAGNLLSLTDALGRSTTYEYDDLDRLLSITDALGGATQFTYDAGDNLLSVTDPLGHATTHEYDHLSRLIRTIDPLDGATSFTYDAMDNLTSTTDPLGRTTGYEYDELDRLVALSDPAGGVTQYGYDPVGNLTSVTDPLDQTTLNSFDALDRLVETRDPLGATTSYTFDAVGNNTSVTDPLGRSTHYSFDLLDRLVTVTDARGAVTGYAYDAVGNRTSVTDPAENITQYEYDSLDLLVREIDPLGHPRVYDYDAVGNLVESTDRNGRTRTFSYDALDRFVEETWWQGTTTVRTITAAYDAAGNLLGSFDPDSRYAYTYDALDRVTTVDNAGTLGSPHIVLSYQYDAVGNVVSTTDNLSASVQSTYDAEDRLLSRVWQGSGIEPVRVDFAYNPRGDRTGIERFSDVDGTGLVGRSSLSYDPVGQLTRHTHSDAVDAVLADYEYFYDLAGQLVRESHHGQTSDYSHDSSGQLVSADYSTQADENYSYDSNGNRLGSGLVNGPGNQLLSDSSFQYTYDAEGNLVRKTEISSGAYTTYEYDHRNRLVVLEEHDISGAVTMHVEFTYDVFDRRIAKTVDPDGAGSQPSETTRFVYDGNHVWGDFESNGNIIARYLYGSTTDEILARHRPSDATAWYLTDRLGTVHDIADATGAVVDHLDYNSFGAVVLETSPATGDRFKFTGREFDAETGLYYFRARYYDSGTGRFISEDPLGFAAGDANLYRYVGNRPLSATDPFGLVTTTETAILQAKQAFKYGAILGLICGAADAFATGGNIGKGALKGAAFGGLAGAFLLPAVAIAAAALPSATVAIAVAGATLPVLGSENGTQAVARGICGFATFCVGARQFGPSKSPTPRSDNCFVAGTSVLLADDTASTATATEAEPKSNANWWLGTVALVIAGAGWQITRPKKDREEEEFDDMWSNDQDEPPEPEPNDDPCSSDRLLPAERVLRGDAVDSPTNLFHPRLADLAGPVDERNETAVEQHIMPMGSRLEFKKPRTKESRRQSSCLWLGTWLLLAAYFFLVGIPTLDFRPASPSASAARTPVSRTRDIADIREGDFVQARDTETGELQGQRVLHTFQGLSDHLRILEIRSADGLELQQLKTTDGHPFWVAESGWVRAGALKSGDRIVQADGQLATVVASVYESHPTGIPVFNIEVDGDHTYFVSQGGARAPPVWVHNKSRVATRPDEAFFWSGRTRGIGGERVAREIAESQGGTTLERLIAQRKIQMPEWNPNEPSSVKAWEHISLKYAENASGTVRAVVGETLRPGNVWETRELPALMQNPNVTRIVVVDPATGNSRVIFARE